MTPSEDMRKFSLIIESVEFKNGVYCCCNPSQETKDAIKSFCAAYDVPNPLSAKDLHCTLIYSDKVDPDFESISTYDKPIEAKFKGFDLFGEDKNTLVILLDSPDLQARHKELMDKYDLNYSWDDYAPHVSLSYDAKDFDISKLDDYNGALMFVGEEDSDLDTD